MNEKKVSLSLEDRLIQVATLYTEGLSAYEIADITTLKPGSVLTYISSAKKKGLISNCSVPKKSWVKTKKISNLIDSNLLKKFINNHSDILDANQFQDDFSIEQIHTLVNLFGYKKEDVNLLVRLYCNHGLFEEAVNLLYNYQENNVLTDKEIKEIEILRHHLRMKEAKHFFGKIPNLLIGNSSDSLDER